MKTALVLFLTALSLAARETDERMVLIPWTKAAKEVPLFYSVTAEVDAVVGLDAVTTEQAIAFRIHQGNTGALSLALRGEGEVTAVNGEGLRDWSVRVAEEGTRFLDVRPVAADGRFPETLQISVRTRAEVKNESLSLTLPGPGEATGFSLSVNLKPERAVDLGVTMADGLVPVQGAENRKFVGTGAASLQLRVSPEGTGARGLELRDTVLTGRVADDGDSVSFHLTGMARSERSGASIALLGGSAALTSGLTDGTTHVALRRSGDAWVYDLVADMAGEFPVSVHFDVPVTRKGDWRQWSFTMPSGVVVPVKIHGLGDAVSFDPSLAVVPERSGDQWRGFLPANGHAAMAWREKDQVADGSLFFSSTATTDVRVGSGLMRQETVVDLRVLQGKLGELTLDLDGPGEVLSVSGDSVLGWNVKEAAGKRSLAVNFSRPIEKVDRIVIEAQAALGGLPMKIDSLRMTPLGALRHSGWLRVANDGAVRFAVAEAKGLIQLAPGQFPGTVDENLRLVFVYRFPAADYGYTVSATQVLPEVGLTEVTVYELAETDHRIVADLELDIREAPLRDWEMEIPADHAVAAVTGAQVADYAVAAEAKDGTRALKILFKQPVIDRQLVSVRLEKNQPAAAGAWRLQPLGFPGVKSRRGYIGAVSAPGYRIAVGNTTGLAEVPVTFFPRKTGGLQQAFRLRDDTWSADLTVEALGQSIQADVFHLYSLKSGAVYGSVLMNFFVVGSPASEWRVSVPEGIGNIDVTGQNVGRDWRRDGNTVIVPLSRPLLGAGTLLLTFEQPMNPQGGSLSPGEVRPLDVQGERGFVQVVSPLQVKHTSNSDGALLKIDPSEIPTEFRLLSSAPTLGAWQYTARDFRIGMDIEWFEPGETVDQVVDFQKLGTQVSRDGQWVTDARIFVKSRGRGALRMTFPEGAVLMEARVNGAAVNVRSDGRETLVPLPARLDPNDAVEVALRYGARAKSPRKIDLTAPALDAPVAIGEWTVAGDEGRRLVPRGGSADLTHPVLAENGWEWLSRKRVLAALLLLAGIAALGFASVRYASLLANLFLTVLAICAVVISSDDLRGGSETLEYAAPVVAAGEPITVEVANLPAWLAGTGWLVWVGIAFGLIATLRGWAVRDRNWTAAGAVALAASLLSIRSGVPWLFVAIAVFGLIRLVPQLIAAVKVLKKPKAAAATAAALVFAMILPSTARADTPSLKAAESMVHQWQIRDGRLYGTVDLTVHGQPGDRFLLLKEPAVLGSFEGAGLRVVKGPLGDQTAYWLVVETGGRLGGKAVFEMPLANPAQGWHLPGGPAAMRRVTVIWNQNGWEFFSSAAAKVQATANPGPNQSGATLTLAPADEVVIQARPRQRDAATEETKFFAEVSNLFVPGPGVVNGRHRVTIRPAQGRVANLTTRIPDGFTVSDVTNGPVGQWRFDPEKNELRLDVEPAQTQPFAFTIDTQRSADALPVDLALEPARVPGAAGEVGLLGIAFGEDVQPEAVTLNGLSRVNPQDFDARLLPHSKEGQPLAILQHAFRYGADVAQARLKVTAVAPELRAESWQLVSLGEDRLVITTDLAIHITRSGVFSLDLDVPAGLEIESATGEGLSHWTEAETDGQRVLTFHLTGKTIGHRNFNLTLTGRPTGAQENWTVPRVSLRGASRETGVLTVVPERGLQVRATDRRNVSQLDPRELAGGKTETSRAAARPGALAYRLLQADWSLALSISRLDPWVTARIFHDATLREGQLLTKAAIQYRIDNAAVKSLRVRIPGLDENAAATVRATGNAVADLVPIERGDGLYEIRFQRGIAGETTVDLEYQLTGPESGEQTIAPVVLEDVRQSNYFVAVRAGGRLELEAGSLPRGWQRTDWAVVRSTLGHAAGSAAPVMSFRVADPEGPLPVVLKRHELAGLRKLRVSEGTLTTLMSAKGDALTAVDLKLHVTDKSTLRLKLPEGAELFNVRVNDEGAPLVREGTDWLFHVFPSPGEDKPAAVRFVYSAGTHKGRRLEGPVLDVPMENLTWRVLVPEGWRLADHDGDFDLKEKQQHGSFKLEDYQSFVLSKRRSDTQSAVARLDQANAWLAAGDQEKASIALSNAVNQGQLDAASGEDARVQLRQLKSQQAVLGLNTRRQKLVLENRFAAPQGGNEQLERAAGANPVLQGSYNFDPKQFDRFLEGNTADENAALKEIANRIVAQQLAAEPAPAALDVTLPERGTVLEFGRSVQVDGERPMAIELKLKRASAGFSWAGMLVCLLIGLAAAWKCRVR